MKTARFLILSLCAGLILANCGRKRPSHSKLQNNTGEIDTDSLDTEGASVDFAQKSFALTRVTELEAAYLDIRDNQIFGKEGILAAADVINSRTYAWFEGWKKYDQFVADNIADRYEEIQPELRRFQLDQHFYLEGVLYKHADLNNRMLEVLTRINGLALLSFDPRGFQGRFKDIKDGLYHLRDVVKDVEKKANDHITAIRSTNNLINGIMHAKVAYIFTASAGENLTSLTRQIDNFFKANDILRPIVNKTMRRARDLNVLALSGQYFKMKRDMGDFEAACANASLEVNAIAELDAKLKELALSEIKSECEQTLKYKAGLERNIAATVASSAKARAVGVGRACSGQGFSGFDCKRYQWVAQISREQILKMDMKMLEAFEKIWDEVGPFPVAQ